MILVYFIVVYSLPVTAFFALWQVLNMLYVVFFPSKLVDGYFSYKPDIVEIQILYRRNSIYMLNCLRYLFGIERPPMPWYAKINTVFCALGVVAIMWAVFFVILERYLLLINLDEWMDILRAHDML